jgi:type 1 glutamine amidotransferase
MSSCPWFAAFAVLCLGMAAVNTSLGGQPPEGARKLRVLIIDGADPYHHHQNITPVLKRLLEESGRFTVEVAEAVTPEQTANFRPRFADYDVVVNAYVGTDWPEETKEDFAAYVAGGGGFVCVHAGNNAFANWPEYNRMIGLGGWGGRDEKAGPYVYYNDRGDLVRDASPGRCGHHGPQHEFQIQIRDANHPITRGLPPAWLHTKDELYDSLRGPAENLDVLATAWSDPKWQGTGRHEPMLMAIRYGKGRAFHTAMGHADYSMADVGFITTLLRGAEWAATGKVTIPVPDDFPTADKTSSRD